MTTGVILMTYGAPRDRAEVPSYLAKVRGGKVASDELVAEMTRRYERIEMLNTQPAFIRALAAVARRTVPVAAAHA